MSTNVTVAVAKPNHLPVKVYVEQRAGAQWVPAASEFVDGVSISVGGAETFLVHDYRRLIIEEVKG